MPPPAGERRVHCIMAAGCWRGICGRFSDSQYFKYGNFLGSGGQYLGELAEHAGRTLTDQRSGLERKLLRGRRTFHRLVSVFGHERQSEIDLWKHELRAQQRQRQPQRLEHRRPHLPATATATATANHDWKPSATPTTTHHARGQSQEQLDGGDGHRRCPRDGWGRPMHRDSTASDLDDNAWIRHPVDAFIDDPATVSDKYLDTPGIAISSAAQ